MRIEGNSPPTRPSWPPPVPATSAASAGTWLRDGHQPEHRPPAGPLARSGRSCWQSSISG